MLWIFLGCYLGSLIINPRPYISLLSLSIPLALILLKYDQIGFYVIMFSVFFADWFKELGLIPDQMTWLPDVVLLILSFKVVFLRQENKGLAKISVTVPIVLLILSGLLSTLLNSGSIITTILGFRQDLKFVLMFFLLVKLNPEERFFRQMIRLLITLLIIQVPVALVKSTIYGQGESAIGTYAVHGGTYSTILPLVAISIFLGFFLFEKPRLRYILLCSLFILFSIVGGKRAFLFFGVLLSLFLFWQAGGKNLGKLACVVPFLMLGFLMCVYFVPSLKPAVENPRHLIDFSVSYTTGYDERGATGRASAIQQAYKIAKNSPQTLLLGYGPGSLTKMAFKEATGKDLLTLEIAYGGSQWVLMSLEYGFVGVLLFLWLFFSLFRINQRFFDATSGKYWKAISFGFKGIWFTYLMGFFYGRVFRLDVLAFILWFFAATICCLRGKNPGGEGLS